MTIDSLLVSLKRVLSSFSALISSHKIIAGLVLFFVVGGIVYFAIAGGDGKGTDITITPKPFVQEITVSGKVQAASSVDMTFEETGRIARVYVEVGDEVSAGDPLVSIASATLSAQLAAAQAEVVQRRVERANQGVNLDEVRREQDTKVESAYRTLLSDDLIALAQSATYDATAPLITGLYASTEEGTYKVSVRNTAGTDEYKLFTFDLETTSDVRISKTGPTALGTRGLYLSFPDPMSSYRDTTWYVSIPNTKSSSYAANYNAYQEALRERTRAIEDAQAQLAQRDQGTTIADAALASAQAEVARLSAELAKYTLRAPFDGVVTQVDVEVGDTAALSTPAVTVMGDDGLEIESFVPEINIAYLEVGDVAVVTLDAYGETVPFPARVVAIDPAETVRDGVSTYRVRLHFDVEDERIRSGMTANIVITTDSRENVISIPQGAVSRKDGVSYVSVRVGAHVESREVQTGPVSSLGEVEIVSGLVPGDVVVLQGS